MNIKIGKRRTAILIRRRRWAPTREWLTALIKLVMDYSHETGAEIGTISAERYQGPHPWLTWTIADALESKRLITTRTTVIVGFESTGWPIEVWAIPTDAGRRWAHKHI